MYQKLQLFKPKLHKFKDVKATGEAFSPQKRTSSTLKNEIYYLFSIFLGHFFILGSDSGSAYGSRDSIESGYGYGSGSTTLNLIVNSSYVSC